MLSDDLTDILTRSNIVGEWPDDEVSAYRDNGGFSEGMAAVNAVRVQKIITAVAEARPATAEEAAEWQASQPREAAPSDSDREALTLDQIADLWDFDLMQRWVREKLARRIHDAGLIVLPASSRAPHPVQVEAAPSDTDREALAWVDRHNDVWVFPGGGDTGYSFETQPFSREHIEKKWGPLEPLSRTSHPVQVEAAPSDTETWSDLQEGIAEELELGGDASTLVARVREWLSRTSHPVQVEVTGDMLMQAAGALHDRQWRNSKSHPRWSHCGRFDTDHRTECLDDTRAALSAALGGGE